MGAGGVNRFVRFRKAASVDPGALSDICCG